MLSTSKNIWGFDPRSVPGCVLWLDAADNSTMNSTTTVTQWNDKSGQSNTMTGTATWNGTTMTFNGTNQAFSNLTFTFPYASFSLFGVYSNTTAPAATAYMNAAYAGGGYPMIGTYDVNKFVTARGVVGNTGALVGQVAAGWAAQMTGITTSQDVGTGIATDSSGNVFVTGYYMDAFTLYNTGGTTGATLPITGITNALDCFLAKYSSSGTVLWATRIGSTLAEAGLGVATDTSGNVFVTGYFSAAVTLYNTGGGTGATLTFAGSANCFLAKYSSAGAVVWAVRIQASGSTQGSAIATDSSGNVFVTGYYDNILTLYNASGTTGATLPVPDLNDVFIAKYTSAGTVSWAARISGTSNDLGNAVATDTSGNVFVTGYYRAALTLYNTGGTTGATLPFTGGFDCFIAKYSSTGTVLWAAQMTGTTTSFDNAYGIATDSSGNVFVTGQYSAAFTLYNTGGTTGATLPAPTNGDCFVGKYSSSGTVLWAARIGSTNGDIGNAVATDSSGNVFVTGYYGAALTLYNTGGTTGATLPLTGANDGFIVKYTSAGAVSWAAQSVSAGTNSRPLSLAIDTSGNVFATGNYNATFTLNNTGGTTGPTLPFTGGADAFIVKYSPDGFVSNPPTPASSNVVVDTTYTGTTLSPYANGVNQTTLSATTVAATGFYVGGPSNYFNGSVSELLIYNNTLTSNQRSAVEGYLASKWGVKSRLPTTHPFYVTPAFNRAFSPTDVPTCALWLDASDNSTMNSTTTVTTWNDKSGLSNTMTGTATWTGSNMTFNGSTQAFSNTSVVFPYTNFSMFGVYSNTTAPAATSYMNVMYATGGYPMIGTYDVGKNVSMRGVVGNTGAVTTSIGWAAQITGTTTSFDVGNAVATDTSGNVFVTGYYGAALTLYNTGGGTGATLAFTGGQDVFVAKYSSAGAVVWAAQITGTTTSSDIGNGIATDTSGNVFVTGYYGAALTLYNTGGTTGATLAYTGGTDCFVAKYSSAGAVSWATRIAGAGNDFANGIATDTSGNVFVTGSYPVALTLYNTGGTTGATLPFTGGSDCFVAKYSSAGAVVWAAQITGTTTSGDIGRGITTDTSGNVFVIGTYSAALTLYNTGGTTGATLPFTGGGLDCFVAKYSSAGAVVWAAQIAGTGTDFGYGIATDSSGNVFVSGQYDTAALTLYNTGGTTGATLAFTGGQDCFVAKYSSAGAVVWAAQIGSTSDDRGYGIATDSSGNVFVTGFYSAALTLYNTGGTTGATLAYTGGGDCFVAKYSSAGAVVWATRIAGTTTSDDRGQGIATDTSGNVFVTGYYSAALTLYNTGGTTGATLPFTGGNDVFVAKYSANGYFLDPTPASSNVLVDATYTGTTLSPYINGSNRTTLTATTAAATGIYIGGPTNYFNGSISELLVYGSSLTAAQRQQVEGYLTQKWGLTSQVVSTHPYKTIPPSVSLPAQYYEVTPGNWARDWQPYLQSLAAANSSGITYTTTNITGGATYTANGWYGAGVLAPDGNLYFAPYGAANILKLTVATGQTTNITGGATFTSSGWAGGVLGPDGNIYFTPLNALNILKLNPTTGVTSNITGGATYVSLGWYGGVVGPDGNIYFSPRNALNILKLNPFTGVTTNITGGATFTGTAKWACGVLGPDGNIYFPPLSVTNILKLNVATGQTTNITGGASFISGSNWVAGVLAPDGNIYFGAYTATNFLKLNVATGVTTNITGSATYLSGGWIGSVLGPDGNIYCAPASASNILQLNVATGATSNITGGASFTGGWFGGTLAFDGSIYFSPQGAANILKLSFTGLSRLPSSNYCLSAWANKF